MSNDNKRNRFIEFREKYFRNEENMRLSLFNIITFFGIVGGTISQIFAILNHAPIAQTLTVGLSLIIAITCIIIGNRSSKLDLAAFLIIFDITLILFPVIFFCGGGIRSGIGFWMVMGLLFDFMLLEGWLRNLLFLLDTAMIITCYTIDYYHPEFVTPIGSEQAYYVDYVSALLIFAIVLGSTVHFQTQIYKNALKHVEEQKVMLFQSERRADRANEAKSDFLSNMSHELLTPIHNVMGMNEMILRKSNDADVRAYAASVERSMNMLLTIVNDLIDMEKLEAGDLPIVEDVYSMKALLVDLYHMVEPSASAKGLKFDIMVNQVLPTVYYGSRSRIMQILLNFLSNALKYTNEGSVYLTIDGVMESTYEMHQQNDIALTFTVVDTGEGITKENLERLFENFERVDLNRHRNIAGAGIGLSLSNLLSRAMGGNIGVQSEYGKGSSFSLSIRQKVIDATMLGHINGRVLLYEDPQVEELSYTAPEARILVVDDVPSNLDVFCNLLKDTQIQISPTISGKEAIKIAAMKQFDLIVLDQMMPEMDGEETFRCLNELAWIREKNVPVIMLTANVVAGMKEHVISLGFSDFVEKPVNGKHLLEIVAKYLPDEKLHWNTETRVIESQEKEETANQTSEKAETKSEEKGLPFLVKEIPSLDPSFVIREYMGTEEFYIKMLKDYATNERVPKLATAFKDGDWKQYQIEAHSLKSTSKMIGLMEGFEFGKALEEACKEENLPYIREHHKETILWIRKMNRLIEKAFT